MDFTRFLAVLAGGRRVLLLCLILGLVSAAAAYAAVPRTYESTAQAVLTQQLPEGVAQTQQDPFATDVVSNYARIATTPFVLDRVRERLQLRISRADLVERVEAAAVPSTAVIEVTASGPQADQAAALANAVVEQLGRAVTQITPGGTGGAVIRLTQVQQAISATSPAFPRAPIFGALGLVVGLVLGMALVIGRELLHPRLRSARDVEDAAGALVVGELPGPRRGDRGAIAVTPGSRRARARAHRELRTNVLRLLDDARGDSLVVSGVEAAPVDETAANLALSLSDAGRSVLLVDADIRRGRSSALFGADGAAGFAQVLEDGGDPLEAVVPAGDGRIRLLPAGASELDPSDLLQQAAVPSHLARMRSRFDVVVVVAPPLPEIADAGVLASMTAGVLLVVPTGTTRSERVERAVGAVERAGGRVLGAVRAAPAPSRRPLRQKPVRARVPVTAPRSAS